jgi:chemotaxis protein CheD
VKVFLKPGELYLGKRPVVISTILDSCLSITMFNARLGVGGICDALLSNDSELKKGNEFRYAQTGCVLLKKLERMQNLS